MEYELCKAKDWHSSNINGDLLRVISGKWKIIDKDYSTQ